MVFVSYVERYNVFIGINKPTIEVAMLYDDLFLVEWTLFARAIQRLASRFTSNEVMVTNHGYHGVVVLLKLLLSKRSLS